jgi:hypothetical protein
MIPVGISVFIAGVVVGSIATNPVKPRKIDNQYVYLKGACSLFLNQLPDVHVAAAQAQAEAQARYANQVRGLQ